MCPWSTLTSGSSASSLNALCVAAVYAGGTSWRSGSGACAIIEGDAGATGIGAEDAAEAQKLGYRAAMLASVLRSGGRELRRRHLDPFDASDAERVRPAWPS